MFHIKASRLSRSSILFSALAIATLMLGCDSSATVDATSQSDLEDGAQVGICSVQIEFGGRADSKSFDVPCSEDSTVMSILSRSQNLGELKVESMGAGETAFVVSIDEVANEGADGDNWVFRVNGKLGDRSSGIFAVSAGDQILWSLGKYNPELK